MVLGEPLAAGASCEPALVCRSWLVPTRVVNSFAQALIRCAAVRYKRLVGSYPPFWSAVQALQPRPRYAHILLVGAGRLWRCCICTYACLITMHKRWPGPPLCAASGSLRHTPFLV